MGNRAVRDGELSQVVADHLGLDLNLVEDLSVVDTNDGSNHLGDNNHVSEVSLDNGGLLVGAGSLLGLSQLSHQTHGLSVESSGQLSAGTGVDNLGEVLNGDSGKVLEVDSSVGELSEGASLLSLDGLLVLNVRHDGYVWVSLKVERKIANLGRMIEWVRAVLVAACCSCDTGTRW